MKYVHVVVLTLASDLLVLRVGWASTTGVSPKWLTLEYLLSVWSDVPEEVLSECNSLDQRK
jgi:hypothetical protein